MAGRGTTAHENGSGVHRRRIRPRERMASGQNMARTATKESSTAESREASQTSFFSRAQNLLLRIERFKDLWIQGPPASRPGVWGLGGSGRVLRGPGDVRRRAGAPGNAVRFGIWTPDLAVWRIFYVFSLDVCFWAGNFQGRFALPFPSSFPSI